MMGWGSMSLMTVPQTLLALSLWGLPVPGFALGADGIASKYPRDHKIENDLKVVFVETFDVGSISAVSRRWESV